MERAQYLKFAVLSADQTTAERFFLCWETAFNDTIQFAQGLTDEGTRQNVLLEWWNPHVPESEKLVNILHDYEAEEHSDPGYTVLRWFVEKIRKDYSRRDPSTFRLIDFDGYAASVALDGNDQNQEIISPVVSALGFYQHMLKNPFLRLPTD